MGPGIFAKAGGAEKRHSQQQNGASGSVIQEEDIEIDDVSALDRTIGNQQHYQYGRFGGQHDEIGAYLGGDGSTMTRPNGGNTGERFEGFQGFRQDEVGGGNRREPMIPQKEGNAGAGSGVAGSDERVTIYREKRRLIERERTNF